MNAGTMNTGRFMRHDLLGESAIAEATAFLISQRSDFETLRRGHRLPYRHSRAAGHPAKRRSESVSMRDGPGGDPARAALRRRPPPRWGLWLLPGPPPGDRAGGR